MQKLYSIIMISNNIFKEEIILPSGKYCINNSNDIEPDKNFIDLYLPVSESSLRYIEAELNDHHYIVCCQTNENELITKEISYNTPFIYRGKPLFAVKKHHDTWDKHITSEKEQTGSHRPGYLHPCFLFFMLTLSVILIIHFIPEENHNNTYKNHSDIIHKHINNNDYITAENDILILTSDDRIVNNIKSELTSYNIHKIDKSKLKKNKNNIILTPDFGNKKEIIYIHQDNKPINKNTLPIPDKFKNDITIRTLLFSDITKLINNRLGEKLAWYAVKKSNNTIFIYTDKRKDKETDRIINDINTSILSAPGGSLVQYREISHSEPRPGVYGTDNYLLLSDNHIKFTPDNK